MNKMKKRRRQSIRRVVERRGIPVMQMSFLILAMAFIDLVNWDLIRFTQNNRKGFIGMPIAT